jgi:ribonuclease HI
MASKYERKLRPKAEHYVEALSQCGICGTIGRFFQYHVKIAISQEHTPLGTVNLYYSPKKQTFKITTNEVLVEPETLVPLLERCWQGESAPIFQLSDNPPSDGYQLYVDGSFLNGRVGYGVVIVKQEIMLDELYGQVKDAAMQSMRQVGGEIMAVQYGLSWCQDHAVEAVGVFYDYVGIENWATGRWQAKNEFTQAYARFVQTCDIVIRWHKVKSHSGDYWNDRADELAKQGTDAAR